MVTPVRPWLAAFESSDWIEGLFVVNRSHARTAIPHLPVLQARGDGAYAMRVPGQLRDDLETPSVVAPELGRTFDDGDVIWLDGRRRLAKSILSRRANANTLLVTERCDNRCLFCSQPPNDLADVELYRSAALALLNFDTDEYVGISGGEPTLNRDAFLHLLRSLNQFGCRTKLHILSNGRSFADASFAKNVQNEIAARTVLWGVPLYGHRSSLHDALVQAPGAFNETVEGLLNACGLGFNIELRIVPTAQNIAHLPAIVRFVVSSLPTISLISIMNLEPKGWGRVNYKTLYVPVRQQCAALHAAVEIARTAGRIVRLFNYPLCLLTEELRDLAVRSISDWKNYFPQECRGCRLLPECGGFFASASGSFRERVEVQQ